MRWRLFRGQMSSAGYERDRVNNVERPPRRAQAVAVAGLSVCGTAVTDAGLMHLAGLHQLNHLDLGDTRVTDAGLQHLRGLLNLKYLTLTGTGISDTGFRHLDGLPQLEYLNVGNTDVTPAGARDFRKRHACDVDRSW